MSPIDWLCARASGFEELSPEERSAIMHFSLLWSYFEAKALDNRASPKAIVALAQRWEHEPRLNVASAQALAYFRERYFRNATLTHHFYGLRLRRNDFQELVEAVIRGERIERRDCLAALFIIVYRLRNNLFHGNKWDYDLHGQRDNFRHANELLMSALEIP